MKCEGRGGEKDETTGPQSGMLACRWRQKSKVAATNHIVLVVVSDVFHEICWHTISVYCNLQYSRPLSRVARVVFGIYFLVSLDWV